MTVSGSHPNHMACLATILADATPLANALIAKASQDDHSKVDLLSRRLCSRGPTLPIALSLCGCASQQAAVCALFTGDLRLARYAANYYARDLCPQRANHANRVASLGLNSHRICLFCWHEHRNIALEDETHAVFVCPYFEKARAKMMSGLCADTRQYVQEAPLDQKLFVLLASRCPADWECIGAC
eukprot:12420789-Karenia_brevis.AAC.1